MSEERIAEPKKEEIKMGIKAIDLSGQKFGRLTVIGPTGEKRNGAIIYECICDCGNTTYVRSFHLKNGHTKSCGCLSRQGRVIDITGQKFGRLTVIEQIESSEYTAVVWKCQCDCGNVTYVIGTHLRKGLVKSCGCINKLDITGQRFGKLVAIAPASKNKSGQIIWKCQCDCGNIAYVTVSNLRSGNTKSCGCLKSSRRLDVTGQRFGKLVAIAPASWNKSSTIVWKCQCDCGNITYVTASNLKKGNTKSCGCLSREVRKNRKRRKDEEIVY